MTSLRDLLKTFPREGRLDEIVVRVRRGEDAVSVTEARAMVGLGLEGDRAAEGRKADPARKRQVTLIQAEHLPAVAGFVGLEAVSATLLRRNLVISGINLAALRAPYRDMRFGLRFFGDRTDEPGALLEVTGACDPCSAMERALGPGGYAAMRSHGGITARVLEDGVLRVGMAVRAELLA